MAIQHNKILYLNGSRFKRALIAGAKNVIARQNHLNKINVFPVADSDTGTNISITLNSGLKAVALQTDQSLEKILDAFADGTLEAARGNSGTIFAQWFQGFVDAITTQKKLTVAQFIHAFQLAAEHAQKAVAEPVAGTVLTVLNDTANYLSKLKNPPDDFVILFSKLLIKANESLQETPKKLKLLKKFGVVDAGAQALVDFFQGIANFINKGNIKDLNEEIAGITANETEETHVHFASDNIDDYTYRYCTECIIVGEHINADDLKASVSSLGDSLVIADSKRKTKLHIHVNQPAELFRICRQYGKIHNEKAEDMFHQIKDAHTQHSEVAIVTDSALDLPQAVLDSLNIHVVPIRIHVGDEAFIDRISITPGEFYKIVTEQDTLPKTAHPTYRDFKAKYEFLRSHYKATISLHIAKIMSNTLSAAELAQQDMSDYLLSVIDTQSISIGQGLIVQYAGELAKAGYAYSDIIKRINAVIPKTRVYALIGNLEYAVKGGRLPKFVKNIADIFNIKPILDISLGKKPKIIGVIRGKKYATRQFAKKTLAKLDPSKHYRIGVLHGEAPEEGQKLLELLTLHTHNIESSFLVDGGVTIGSHSGPGTLGIAIQEYLPL